MQLHPVRHTRLAITIALLAGIVIAPRALAQNALAPTVAAARSELQRTSPLLRHSLTGMVGQFFYDAGGDRAYPLANVRYTRSFGRYVFGEGGLGYAHAKTGAAKSDGSDFRYVATPILLADVGIFVQVALGPVAPFAGLTGGVFRRAGNGRRDAVTGVGAGAAGGLRVRIARSVFLRAEINVRSDDEGTSNRLNATQAIGLGYSF